MAGIKEEETWESDVYQLEVTDPVQGGPEGIDNIPHKALANRTVWLKAQLALKSLIGGSATQLFKVKAAVASDEAVNKQQMETAINGFSNITGFKNLIINGDLRVNQRGALSIDETASAYNYDRWYYDGTNFIQFIEDKNLVLTGTYTLSWIGTATATVNGTNVSNGGQVTLTKNTQIEVKFNSSDFKLVQLEYGSKKTNFEIRPYSIEFDLCLRYFEVMPIYSTLTHVDTSNSTVHGTSGSFKKTKRIQPSFNTCSITHVNGGASYSNQLVQGTLTNIIRIGQGTSWAGAGSYIYYNSTSIDVDSEIYPT